MKDVLGQIRNPNRFFAAAATIAAIAVGVEACGTSDNNKAFSGAKAAEGTYFQGPVVVSLPGGSGVKIFEEIPKDADQQAAYEQTDCGQSRKLRYTNGEGFNGVTCLEGPMPKSEVEPALQDGSEAISQSK